MNPTARLVVCEKSGRWAAALRRELSAVGPRVHETRHVDDAWHELRIARASFVVLEASRPRLAAVVHWLTQLGRVYPRARALIVGGAELEAAEWLLREAGALAVHVALADPAIVVRLARRHLAEFPSADRSWRQQCFDRLPWPAVADPA